MPRPHHHPVAAVVRSLRIEVSVVGGNRMITMTLDQQTVKIAGVLAFAVVFLAGGVEYVDGRGRFHGEKVAVCEVVPGRMGQGHISPGMAGAASFSPDSRGFVGAKSNGRPTASRCHRLPRLVLRA